tara:strand:+ start:338 stop:1009 length:672 start_codon:yes stop_codon:yes gene_type:complete
MEKNKIEYSILTWGPCVVKLKITDAFYNVLVEEADKAQKLNLLYSKRLAGIIQKEYHFKDLSIIEPYLSDLVKIYDQIWDKWRNADEMSKHKYMLNAAWVNYQRRYEFNPPHDHSDELSFIAYLKIPKEIKEENEAFEGKSSGPGGLSFIYGEGDRQAITYQAHFPAEKDLFMFPAWLKHYVAPFTCNVERVSVSGNLARKVDLSALKKTDVSKVEAEKKNEK